MEKETENKWMSYYDNYIKEENLRLERHIKIQDIEIESLNIEIESLKQKLKNK